MMVFQKMRGLNEANSLKRLEIACCQSFHAVVASFSESLRKTTSGNRPSNSQSANKALCVQRRILKG